MANYTVIDQIAEIQPALAKLREPSKSSTPFLAIDCEGEKLSRKGVLSIVSVATEGHAYLFDIKKLGARVFDDGLRELLEDPSRYKLMYDCRQDSDCLWHQFKVKLANVLDLQLMQVIHEETNVIPGSKTHRARSHLGSAFQPRLRGYALCLQVYIKDDQLIRAKTSGKLKMEKEGAWLERPLDEALLAYAAVDVHGLFLLYRALQPGLGGSDAMARLQVASQRYLEFLRSEEVRSYDQFETNAYVPWRILPKRGQTSEYLEETMCRGCKRRFPGSDFAFSGLSLCPVCKKIQAEN